VVLLVGLDAKDLLGRLEGRNVFSPIMFSFPFVSSACVCEVGVKRNETKHLTIPIRPVRG
jgi:hypothetical protein